MEENVETYWFEKYLGLIREEFNKDPELLKLLSTRNEAAQRHDSLKREILKVENEINDIEGKAREIVNHAVEFEKKTSDVNQIKLMENEIRSLADYKGKLNLKGEGVRHEMAIAEKNLGVAIKRALRKIRIQEQAVLDEELRVIANRIFEFTRAGRQAVDEINGKIFYYFLGDSSYLNIGKLLKEMKY